MTNRDLALAALNGDRSALRTLLLGAVERHYAIAFAIVQQQDVADEIMRCAAESALERLPDLADPGDFNGWFRKIVLDQALHTIRVTKHYAHAPAEVEKLPSGWQVGSSVDLRGALIALPAYYRRLIVLSSSGLSTGEMIEVLGKSPADVRQHVGETYGLLRSQMSRAGQREEAGA